MHSYTPIFRDAEKIAKKIDYSKTFEYFHSHPELYHFIMAPESQLSNDSRALNQAKEISPEIYQALFDKGPSLLGKGSPEIDGVESRHILILTYLISILGTEWGNVIEIGGGYGNYFRLIDGIVGIENWAIIDLNYIIDLQRWFLKTLGVNNLAKVKFYSFDEIAANPEGVGPYDLLLAVHSLSEFDMETFTTYLPIINKSRWLCYVSQVNNPSKELLDKKQQLIRKQFSLEHLFLYEGGTSVIYLFLNRDI